MGINTKTDIKSSKILTVNTCVNTFIYTVNTMLNKVVKVIHIVWQMHRLIYIVFILNWLKYFSLPFWQSEVKFDQRSYLQEFFLFVLQLHQAGLWQHKLQCLHYSVGPPSLQLYEYLNHFLFSRGKNNNVIIN